MEGNSDDGDESYKKGGDTSGDDSDSELDSDDGYDGRERSTEGLFRHTKGPYRDIERLLKDKEAWRRLRRQCRLAFHRLLRSSRYR